MKLRPIATVALATLAGLTLHAQSTGAASLDFEVAAFKPTADTTLPGRITRLPGERGYHGTNMPLRSYLTVAYQCRASQISGPDWIDTERFDMEAKAERPSTVDELHVMLQHLLADRFHMKLRHETREQSGFQLVVEKGGSKLTNHDPEDKTRAPILPGWGKHIGNNVTMTYFAFYLSNELDKTVVDKTGLTGFYDFQAEWYGDSLDTSMPAPAPPPGVEGGEMRMPQPPRGPTLFDALKQQLGLRLDSAKVPSDHLVIDHIEKLVENQP